MNAGIRIVPFHVRPLPKAGRVSYFAISPIDYDVPWPGASPDIGTGSWIGLFFMRQRSGQETISKSQLR